AKLQHLIKSLITWKRYMIVQKITLITNRKSAIAFQNPPLYLTCDSTWWRNRRYVTSGLLKKSQKSCITLKRYVIEQKLTLFVNRKAAIAFQNPPLYLTCDATWRRNWRYVTSGLIATFDQITYNLETVHYRANVYINHKLEVGNCLSESAIIFDL